MIKPNWDIFQAKFSENPQDSFEWFCYILFCKEFDQEKGVFRFKNHHALETNLINYEGEMIGWQAKYYETSLSDHKDALLDTLIDAKNKYPDMQRFIIYTNQEWGQNKQGGNPIGLNEINQKAEELKVVLDWRTASYFESPFVSMKQELVAKHFFANEKSIFDEINKQNTHTNIIIQEIRTSIAFNSQTIEIDRGDYIDIIKESGQVLVLSGMGGVGKTALVKKLYENDNNPFYIFKATEFDIRHIDDFFRDFDFQEFVNAHNEDDIKTIVIDSAEKLLDLENTSPFKEALMLLIASKWKIIFTTRDNYLDNLNSDFFEVYNIIPKNIHIHNMSLEQLKKISHTYKFALPQDEKLLELLRNPFYLNEYLRCYKAGEQISYKEFKDKIWNIKIIKGKPAREQCFLKIALQRANDGQFFITPDCESSIVDDELKRDGILAYESPRGYFITHDIYEEWGLEKVIDKHFMQKTDNESFFKAIGHSLPIRRSFRNWISENLLLRTSIVIDFIEEVINDTQLDQIWINEILVSILLSDYSDYFFDNFKTLLFDNDQAFLKKVVFWLRIACKEVDEEHLEMLGIKDVNLSTIQHFLTKPKGKGWESIIKFVFDNLDEIGLENLGFILPVIHDWNAKFKHGVTTKYASLLALKYYQRIIKENVYLSGRRDESQTLFQTILYGAFEIRDELSVIFEEILENKWKKQRDPYYDLSKNILTKLDGYLLVQVLPEYVLQLANLFWTYSGKEEAFSHRMGVEQYFFIEENHHDYYPASAYQTPISLLLKNKLKETIDFIIDFTNRSVEKFAKSDFAQYEVDEIDVFVDDKTTVKQFICNRIWCIYRGTQVAPHLLESMHMALEKFFLEKIDATESETLEYRLIYLLRNTKSASISALVASIVVACPDKTFNVAKILFQTKEFFHYDMSRWVLDQGHKSQLMMLNDLGINYKNKIFENERLNACDAPHRKKHLENIFLQYQIFRTSNVTEEEILQRQEILWAILDNYYKGLPSEKMQNENDKTRRIFLARMDYRKMDVTTKETEDGIEVHRNPEIEPKLKKYQEESLKENDAAMKFIGLKLRANYRNKNDDKYKQYKTYEEQPKLALKEAKELIKQLKAKSGTDEGFYIMNSSIPADVCAALIRDFSDILSKSDIAFCKDVIVDFATLSFRPNYRYQIGDGVQSAISVLPILFNHFPEEREQIVTILLLLLFDRHPMGLGGTQFNDYAVASVHKLGEKYPKIAQSLLFGYLILHPKYELLREKLIDELHSKQIYQLNEYQIVQRFVEENEKDLQKIIEDKGDLEDSVRFENLDLFTLKTAFQLIPLTSVDVDYKKTVNEIIALFVQKVLVDTVDDRIDETVKYIFLTKLSYFVLSAKKEDIADYLKPFIENFSDADLFEEFFNSFILAEDHLDTYDNFWQVWELFKNKIIQLSNEVDKFWRFDKIIQSYLFASTTWKDTTKSRHTLKDVNKAFLKDIAEKVGHLPATLYAIAKLGNDIGAPYLDDVIKWISTILRNNKDLVKHRLETNTIYYIERNIRRYIYKNREEIRRNKNTKDDVLIILDFLITNNSVVGYLLKENIL